MDDPTEYNVRNILMIKGKRAGRSTIKRHILTLLRQKSFEEICSFFENNPNHLVLNALFGALCSPVESVRWSSIECFGIIVPRIAERKTEDARIVMRHFLWSLNDESGGIGWGAPESLAEIMCHCQQMRSEYLHMLVSYMRKDGRQIFQDGNYLELPMLQRGLLWGIGRLCECHPDEMAEREIVKDVSDYLSSPDLHVAGLAIWILGFLREKSAAKEVAAFADREDLLFLYRSGRLEEVAIGQLAEEALLLMD